MIDPMWPILLIALSSSTRRAVISGAFFAANLDVRAATGGGGGVYEVPTGLTVSIASHDTPDVPEWLKRSEQMLDPRTCSVALLRSIACKRAGGSALITVVPSSTLDAFHAFQGPFYEQLRSEGLIKGKVHQHTFETRFFKGGPNPPAQQQAGAGIFFGAHRTASLDEWTRAAASPAIATTLDSLGVSFSWCGELLSSTDVLVPRGRAVAFLDIFPDGPQRAIERDQRTRGRGGMVASAFVAPGFGMSDLFAGPMWSEALEVLRDKIY